MGYNGSYDMVHEVQWHSSERATVLLEHIELGHYAADPACHFGRHDAGPPTTVPGGVHEATRPSPAAHPMPPDLPSGCHGAGGSVPLQVHSCAEGPSLDDNALRCSHME
jgi:hypothetical protein